jgi:hypothetical protein
MCVYVLTIVLTDLGSVPHVLEPAHYEDLISGSTSALFCFVLSAAVKTTIELGKISTVFPQVH